MHSVVSNSAVSLDVQADVSTCVALLSNFDGMVYRMRRDPCWTVEFVSAGCLSLTGYAPHELVFNQVVSFEEITHAEDRQRVRCAIDTAVALGQRYNVEYRIVRKDGSVCWVVERGSVSSQQRATALPVSSGRPSTIEGFILDISERKQAEHALREAERRYRSIFENAIEGIFQSTPDNHYLTVNPSLARIYGYASPADLMANLRNISGQLYVDPARRCEFIRLMETDGYVTDFQSEVYRRDRSVIWISENARAVRDAAGKVLFFEGTVEDITKRKRHEAEIQYQASHDPLTGLYNRTALYAGIAQAIQAVQGNGGQVAVVFLDLDQFKYINDSLGHQVGDHYLRTVANRLRSCVRDSDMLARQGGDEFVLVLGNQHSPSDITHTVDRILGIVSRPWMINGLELQVTCSIGISLYPTDALDADSMLRHADTAMFKAKSLGRNTFQFYSDKMMDGGSDRLGLLSRLRQTLETSGLVLHYQPRQCLKTGRIVAAEALVRWPLPDGTLVSPADFIPLAEESGLIVQLGDWVLREACRQLRQWIDEGTGHVPISVNVSRVQLEREDLAGTIADILATYALPAALIELEVTESAVMGDVEKSLNTLRQLKALGVGVAIDDFGTGYSSLSYLRRFPVDTLKVDRSFMQDTPDDKESAGIVAAVIALAHTLGLSVVAEGVETAEAALFLQDLNCDQLQGYHFSRPVPADAFHALLLQGVTCVK